MNHSLSERENTLSCFNKIILNKEVPILYIAAQ